MLLLYQEKLIFHIYLILLLLWSCLLVSVLLVCNFYLQVWLGLNLSLDRFTILQSNFIQLFCCLLSKLFTLSPTFNIIIHIIFIYLNFILWLAIYMLLIFSYMVLSSIIEIIHNLVHRLNLCNHFLSQWLLFDVIGSWLILNYLSDFDHIFVLHFRCGPCSQFL